jgi:hypothetical protein
MQRKIFMNELIQGADSASHACKQTGTRLALRCSLTKS